MQDHKNLRKKHKNRGQNSFLSQNNVNNFNVFKQMRSSIAKLMLLSIFIASTSIAQKRWDGEAADGQWNAATNWYPDGVPTDTDLIILNNDFINSSYHIKLPPSSSSVTCSGIAIMPSEQHNITIEIPETNTASPALIVNQIQIEKGGVLLNSSGASAGNTFQINGNIIIRNDGRYIHQTIRGNAYLISKLIHQKGTEKGIIEFNVPGSSGYLISLSGRTFGTLYLGKQASIQSKSYNGTGSNELVILGDLVIDENVNFKSTLTGNIHIKGGISNSGNFFIEPASADTSKRKMLVDGDSIFFLNNGLFEQNDHFNGITVIPGSTFKLLSPLTLTNTNATLHVASNAFFDPGNYYVQGGIFFGDSASKILISSSNGISSNPEKGNIRSTQININSKSSVLFCGEGNQESGELFPDSLSAITIDKTNGNVKLTQSVHITDSLILKKGNIISSDSCKISFSGNIILPNPITNNLTVSSYKGFIEGPFIYYSDSSSQVNLPIGKEEIYAPISIIKDKAVPITYCIEYFLGKSTMHDSIKTYPLDKIDSSQYWKIECINPEVSMEIKSSIYLHSNLNRMESRYNEQCLAYFENKTNTWNNVSLSSNNEGISTQVSSKFLLNEGLFTFGKIKFDVLPISALNATARFVKNEVEVIWNDEKNTETIQYRIETSNDSKIFKPIGILNNEHKKENQVFKFQFIPTENTSLYIRIRAIDSFNRPTYSNIIHLKKYFQVKPLFPNPATNEIYLVVNNDDEKIEHWIIDINGKRIKPISERRGNIVVFRIETLVPGRYVLQHESNGIYKSYPFIKK